ncbi:MAG: hypothetical protein JNJ41_03405 [Bacteroidia bacterium]|nr:hypothetical protein [Bacteroidia bacterium]
MKITKENYFNTINKIGFENLPLVLKQSHTVILTKTVNGEDWSKYQNDADLKRMIDLVFKKLEEFIASNKKNLSGMEEKEEEQMEGTKNNADKQKKVNPYSKIGTEIKFIHRFLAFHDKILYKNTFEIFIDELQKAIKNKEITKKSPVAKDIIAMQNAVIHAFNTMKNAKHFVLKPETIKRYKTIIEKYENAYDDMDDEPTEKKPKRKSIELNGISQNNGKIMSSVDFANMEFSTIGLKDKWLEFIGDPAPGFTAMVYGRPKMGKSYLCVDFAGYLARNHGKVLYVAKEEKLDATLQKKLKEKDVANENLFVSDNLPKSVTGYQFVILDSVNKLELNPKDLEKLKADNKGVSFIYIFQTTKEGKFRGTNEFQHDVDVIIEVPEKGIAIQNGRFNQGGEMRIFDDGISGEDDLSGIRKVKKNSKCEPIIEIETEFSIPLEELAMELISPKKPQEEIVNILDNHSQKADKVVKRLIVDFISDEKVNIAVNKVKFNQMDSVRLSHGVAYFDATLKGTKSELKKIADNDLLFNYDWENHPVNGVSKNENSIVIKPTYSVPLKEFDFLIERRDSVQEAIRAHKSEAERWVKKLAEAQIKKAEAKVKLDAVYFMSNDDEEEEDENEGGFSYYDLRLSGTENELRKVAGKDKDLYYEWSAEGQISGIKSSSSKHNLTLRNNLPLLDGTKNNAMKKTKKQNDWTEPEWLNQADWHNLKIIKKYCDQGKYAEAMEHARHCDTVIREEIPPDVWKKMGGQLTKTGEEKLKAMKQKSSPKIAEQIKKTGIPFNHGVRVLKGVIEREWDLELTDGDYIDILDIAQERNSNLPEIVNTIHNNLSEFLVIMRKAFEEWDKKTGKSVEKSREKFYPEFYANRKDDENPGFLFSLTNTKVLTEALQGDFDLVYLVRRELANRGLNSKGKWVGFDEAKKVHRVN